MSETKSISCLLLQVSVALLLYLYLMHFHLEQPNGCRKIVFEKPNEGFQDVQIHSLRLLPSDSFPSSKTFLKRNFDEIFLSTQRPLFTR